jgi:hypothetical protein
MPFDGVVQAEQHQQQPRWLAALKLFMFAPKPKPVADVADVLVVARNLISDPAHWTQRRYFRADDGVPQRCAVGALRCAHRLVRARPAVYNQAYVLLLREARQQGAYDDIERFNDAASHAAVLRVMDAAILRAKDHNVHR